MKKRIVRWGLGKKSSIAWACLSLVFNIYSIGNQMKDNCLDKKSHDVHVYKKILKNGLTVLVRPLHSIPKVCTQVWYNVGSKNEKTDQKGLAHLIEHMVFKGTQGKNSLNLSESDMNVIVHMLSGNCNAFTSYDYTGYLFNFPTQNWHWALKISADCMRNCAFKDDHLNSEMKAVVQELKMIKDDYVRSLFDELIAAIFQGHPYRDPVIGYKQNLWAFHSDHLQNFYATHYIPNNATVVVVGDVDPEDVFKKAEQEFGSIQGNPEYQKESYFYQHDISAKKITMYRDIQQPVAASVYVIEGSKTGVDSIVDVLGWVLGHGKGSRLHRILVDQEQRVTSIGVYHIDLFEQGLLAILYEPKNMADTAQINAIIQQEINDIATNGFKPGELERAVKNAKMRLYYTFEDLQQQATDIGKYYLATGNPEYIFNYLDNPMAEIGSQTIELCRNYLRASVMHEGLLLPLDEKEKIFWNNIQEQSDLLDEKVLSTHVRATELEPPAHAKLVTAGEQKEFNFPKATKTVLKNGLVALYHNNNATPKIDIILEFKAKSYYDEDDKQGLCGFMNRMLIEGTKKYSAEALANALESRAITFKAMPGGMLMSLLREDLEYGLDILYEIMTNGIFEQQAIEKVRTQILADIKSFWDEPSLFSGQLMNNIIYKGHPYSKDALGTEKSIKSITREDLIQCYKKFISPSGARIALVGDIECYDIKEILEKKLGIWQGAEVKDIEFPALVKTVAHEVTHPITRDQIVLFMAASSVTRTDPDYDKFVLFDQIFGSGVLGSMSSRLFMLREQTGLFYAIGGATVFSASEQPGIVFVKTIVSLDRLKEAEAAIKKIIETVADSIKDYELEEAKRALLNASVGNFESNAGTAKAFIFLDRFNFKPDYFDTRKEVLAKITVAEVQAAVKKVLRNERLVTLKVGRINNIKP